MNKWVSGQVHNKQTWSFSTTMSKRIAIFSDSWGTGWHLSDITDGPKVSEDPKGIPHCDSKAEGSPTEGVVVWMQEVKILSLWIRWSSRPSFDAKEDMDPCWCPEEEWTLAAEMEGWPQLVTKWLTWSINSFLSAWYNLFSCYQNVLYMYHTCQLFSMIVWVRWHQLGWHVSSMLICRLMHAHF